MSDTASRWDSIQVPQQATDTASRWDSIQPAKPAAPAPAPAPKVASEDDPGRFMSLATGAAAGLGRGTLAMQQLLGKALMFAGEKIDNEATTKAGNWLQQDAATGMKNIAAENAPYEAARPGWNMAGNVVGMIANPVNAVIPGAGASSGLAGAAMKGAAQGAALNTLTEPVEEGKPFVAEKLRQAGAGAAGGAIGASAARLLADGFAASVDVFRKTVNKATVGNANKAAEQATAEALAKLGVQPQELAASKPMLFDGLKTMVKESLETGNLDKNMLARFAQAQTLPIPVPMLRSHLNRDAMQYAAEQNLKGIHGVGEPLTAALTSQNRALIENLNALGAKGSLDAVAGAEPVIAALKAHDKAASAQVSAAYGAFRQATGKDLDVPLHGLAQDYIRILDERGPNIPAAVQRKFESLGLLDGKQTKTFSITDAENLIKNYINKNYDPANRPVAGALDELRQSVQKAITEGAGSNALGGEAAALAKAARQAAKARFNMIDSTPGLKAVLDGVEPDKFVQRFVLKGNVSEIKNMMGALSKTNPEAVKSLQDTLMGEIKSKVLNGRTDENGIFSQAQLKAFVTNPNMRARLEAVLGPQKMGVLRQLNDVAENALYDPVASAVNRSNTASAGANLVKSEVQGGSMNSLLEIAKKVPAIATAAKAGQEGVQAKRASKMVEEAVNPTLGNQRSGIPLKAIGDLLMPEKLWSRAGAAYVGERTQ